MTKIHHAVNIAASSEACFKALTDLEMLKAWHHGEVEGEVAPGAVFDAQAQSRVRFFRMV
jgi:hypothetical protein